MTAQRQPFPNSAQLFALVRKVADARWGAGTMSDSALGRIVGFESARTSRWKAGRIAVEDAGRLLALSQDLGVDIAVLADVAAGYLSADEAWEILTQRQQFVRFLGEHLVLPYDDYAVTLVDSDGAEARVVRSALGHHQRRFRRARSPVPLSREERHRCVVLADDDETTVELFANMTAPGSGIEGIVATDVATALLACGIHRPHLLIYDLHLSGYDGLRVLRAVTGNKQLGVMRVVATTRDPSADVIRRATGCGAHQVVERPLRSRALGRLLREIQTG